MNIKSPGQVVSVEWHTKWNIAITVPSVVIGEAGVRSPIIFTLILQYGVGTKVYKDMSIFKRKCKSIWDLFHFMLILPSVCLRHKEFMNASMLAKHVLSILSACFRDFVCKTNHEHYCDWIGVTMMWINLFTRLFIWPMSIVLLCFSLWWVQVPKASLRGPNTLISSLKPLRESFTFSWK